MSLVHILFYKSQLTKYLIGKYETLEIVSTFNTLLKNIYHLTVYI